MYTAGDNDDQMRFDYYVDLEPVFGTLCCFCTHTCKYKIVNQIRYVLMYNPLNTGDLYVLASCIKL